MNFLPDVMVPCEACHGKRYNRETLEVKFKGKSIADVLDMTINQAVVFFENVPNILIKIKTLQDVGLEGILNSDNPVLLFLEEKVKRVKLATELSKKIQERLFIYLMSLLQDFILKDIRILMDVLQKLVDKGNTVIIIEHNMDVIKLADYIIDIGPEGGREGGNILSTGTPEHVARCLKGYTPHFLKNVLHG